MANNEYVLKTNCSEAEFKRKLLIELAAFKDTPVNIFDSEFGEVRTIYPQFMICTVNIHGSYSASIGYDRIEKYEDYENHYDQELRRNIQERVIKERTVIDWRPYSNYLDNTFLFTAGINGSFNCGENEYFERIVDYINWDTAAVSLADSGLNQKFVTPSDEANQEIVNKIRGMSDRVMEFPGDHYKDVQSNFSYRILDTKYCIAPEYVMPFQKDGKQYQLASFTSHYALMGDRPSNKDDITAMINRQSRKHGFLSILLSLLSMCFAVIFPTLIANDFGIILGILSMIPSIVGYKLYKKLYAKKEKAIYQSLLNEKLRQAENYFARNGMVPLTAKEKDLFKI